MNRATLRMATLLSLVAIQLACGGSCLFGPTCDPKTFVNECQTDRSWQTCGFNSWTGNHHLSTITCHTSERCTMSDEAKPTCALEPFEACTSKDARRCDGEVLQACDRSRATVNGEVPWRHERECDADHECLQQGEYAGCVLSPPEACTFTQETRYRCHEGHPQQCSAILGPYEDRPYFWGRVLDPCETDETCLTDGGDIYCVVAPAEPCPTVGEKRCVDGRTQRCLEGGAGVMGPPTPHWTWSSLACSN